MFSQGPVPSPTIQPAAPTGALPQLHVPHWPLTWEPISGQPLSQDFRVLTPSFWPLRNHGARPLVGRSVSGAPRERLKPCRRATCPQGSESTRATPRPPQPSGSTPAQLLSSCRATGRPSHAPGEREERCDQLPVTLTAPAPASSLSLPRPRQPCSQPGSPDAHCTQCTGCRRLLQHCCPTVSPAHLHLSPRPSVQAPLETNDTLLHFTATPTIVPLLSRRQSPVAGVDGWSSLPSREPHPAQC